MRPGTRNNHALHTSPSWPKGNPNDTRNDVKGTQTKSKAQGISLQCPDEPPNWPSCSYVRPIQAGQQTHVAGHLDHAKLIKDTITVAAGEDWFCIGFAGHPLPYVACLFVLKPGPFKLQGQTFKIQVQTPKILVQTSEYKYRQPKY